MAFPYKLNKKQLPLSNPKKELYYAQTTATETISEKEMIAIIAKKSNVPLLDCLKVLLTFQEALKEELATGALVRMGDLGTFRATLSSEGVSKPEDFRSSYIKGINIKFQPAKALKEAVNNNVIYQKIP